MKLLNDFFSIHNFTHSDNGFTAGILLNPEHIIFKGHFPGFPLTPGVIQLQIVNELLENHLGKKIKLTTLSRCKFLKHINPAVNPRISIKMEIAFSGATILVNAKGGTSNEDFFSLTAKYEEAP